MASHYADTGRAKGTGLSCQLISNYDRADEGERSRESIPAECRVAGK